MLYKIGRAGRCTQDPSKREPSDNVGYQRNCGSRFVHEDRRKHEFAVLVFHRDFPWEMYKYNNACATTTQNNNATDVDDPLGWFSEAFSQKHVS